jgi:hypothetical protein
MAAAFIPFALVLALFILYLLGGILLTAVRVVKGHADL